MKVEDERPAPAHGRKLSGQPLASAQVRIHVETEHAQVSPVPRIVDAAVARDDAGLDGRLGVDVVVADSLEDREGEEAILAGEAVDLLELRELVDMAVVGHVSGEDDA